MKILGLSIFIFLICFSISLQQDQDSRVRALLVASETPFMNDSSLTIPRLIDSGCMVGGCYNELCMNLASNITLNCNFPFRNEFKCYEHADCRLLADGRCDWDPKEALNVCLRNARAGIRPSEEPRREELRCVTDGCFNEFCRDASLPRMMLDRCDYRPEFECFRLTRCRPIENRCEFSMNRDFMDCMDSFGMMNARDERRLRRHELRDDVLRVKETMRSDLDLRRDQMRRRPDMEPRNVTFPLGGFRHGRDFRAGLDIDFRGGPEFEYRPEFEPRGVEFNYGRENEGFYRDFPIRESKMVSDIGRKQIQIR